MVETPLLDLRGGLWEAYSKMSGQPIEELKRSILPQIPLGRLGEPEEIARCVVFLAADEAGLITGSTLSANGGQVMV